MSKLLLVANYRARDFKLNYLVAKSVEIISIATLCFLNAGSRPFSDVDVHYLCCSLSLGISFKKFKLFCALSIGAVEVH